MFAERLKEARKKKNIYQKELAAILGVSRSAVTSWETGARFPEFETLNRLADVLEVSIDYLCRTEDPTPKTTTDSQPKQDSLPEFLRQFETRNPDTITIEEAMDMVLRSNHVMFNNKPVGKYDEDTLLDIRDTVVAVIKALLLKKAAAGVRGVLGSCLAAGVGAG